MKLPVVLRIWPSFQPSRAGITCRGSGVVCVKLQSGLRVWRFLDFNKDEALRQADTKTLRKIPMDVCLKRGTAEEFSGAGEKSFVRKMSKLLLRLVANRFINLLPGFSVATSCIYALLVLQVDLFIWVSLASRTEGDDAICREKGTEELL